MSSRYAFYRRNTLNGIKAAVREISRGVNVDYNHRYIERARRGLAQLRVARNEGRV